VLSGQICSPQRLELDGFLPYQRHWSVIPSPPVSLVGFFHPKQFKVFFLLKNKLVLSESNPHRKSRVLPTFPARQSERPSPQAPLARAPARQSVFASTASSRARDRRHLQLITTQPALTCGNQARSIAQTLLE